MPHSTLKLMPGVDQNRTLTLNEAAISYSQLIRFVPDKQGLGLVQKLGGWTRFFPSSVGSTVRALWAWQDTNADSYLGIGAQSRTAPVTGLSNQIISAVNYITITFSGAVTFSVGETIALTGIDPSAYDGSYTVYSVGSNSVTVVGTDHGPFVSGGVVYAADALSVIKSNTRTILTPTTQLQNSIIDPVALTGFTTVAGQSTILVTTSSQSNIYDGDVVVLRTQVSVGGLVLFGSYTASYINGTNQFEIVARSALGDPQPAASSVSYGGAVPVFDFATGESLVDVTLSDHGLFEGDTFTILIPVVSAGVTLYGNYAVSNVMSSSSFSIRATNVASATTTVSMNGGDAQFVYYKTPGVLPTSTGYGIGGYGVGGYGTGAAPIITAAGAPIPSSDWTLDNWGQIFVANPVGGEIFTWNPTSGTTQAVVIGNAPLANDGMFVAMPQRQIVAWGSTFNGIKDPLLIRWSDVDDYNQWIALPTNQAGSYRMPKGSKIVGCIQGPQQGIVWTDLAVWAMQYVGLPYVYQFNEIGNGCGLVARKAATSMNGVVYWMSQSQFFRISGNGVEPIQCPIWDVIFQDIDLTNADKIRVAANSRFGEISWFYPTTTSGGEVAKYVKLNVNLGTWDFGTLSRTAWINQSVLGPPIGASMNGSQSLIYQHETSADADGLPMVSSFQTGYFSISEGEWKSFVDQVWPDMKWGYYAGAQDADLTITFYVADYPHTDPRVYGPYQFNNSTDFLTPRFRARLVSIKLESSDLGSFWRIGATRYRVQQDGKF